MKFDKKIFNEIKSLDNDPMQYFFIEDFSEDIKNDDANQFYLIPSDSILLDALCDYFDCTRNQYAEMISGYYYEATGVVFYTGVGYDWVDEDVLLGNGDGTKTQAFLDTINKNQSLADAVNCIRFFHITALLPQASKVNLENNQKEVIYMTTNYIDCAGDLHIGDNVLHIQHDGSITIANVTAVVGNDVSNWRAEIVAKVRRLGFDPDWQRARWVARH